MKKIAFLCVHNSCRSQIAEALAKAYEAGYYGEWYNDAVELAKSMGLDV